MVNAALVSIEQNNIGKVHFLKVFSLACSNNSIQLQLGKISYISSERTWVQEL